MKTTLNLDDQLLLEAKRLAAERGATLTSIVESALRDALRTAAQPSTYVFDPPVVSGTRLPDVDPADRDALYEYLEGRR